MNKHNFKNMKFAKDVLLNIFAAGLVAVISQFAIYPLLNKWLDSETFGEILLKMSIVNIVAVLLGNSLNNIRLKQDRTYKNKNINGDFLVILFCAGIVNIFFVFCISLILWSNESLFENTLLVVISIFTMLRAYLTVDYRLKLNYRKILQHSAIYSISLCLGTLVLLYTDFWQFVFIVGEGSSLLYLILTTEIFKEKFKITHFFKNTLKQYLMLSISGLISNILNYLDRIIIYPFLGSKQVAVFFAATIIGKMTSFVLSPISGVILSHISQKKEKITLKTFLIINGFILAFSLIATIFTVIISKYILVFFYPNLYSEASEILLLANFGIILLNCSSLSQTFILQYNATYIQVIITSFYGIVYFFLGIMLMEKGGLEGFCIAALVASVIKFIVILIIGSITLGTKNNSLEVQTKN